jgi:hypothetical protein
MLMTVFNGGMVLTLLSFSCIILFSSLKWPKHVGGYPLINLYQNTIEHLLVPILYAVPPSCMRWLCVCVCDVLSNNSSAGYFS